MKGCKTDRGKAPLFLHSPH